MVSSLASRGLFKPVWSGDELVATSLKEGEERALLTQEIFPVSSCSPALTSASFHSLVSLSRDSFQLLVALVVVTEMDLIFSTLKKSLFSHSSGFASTLAKGSETTATVWRSVPTIK